MQWHTVTVYAQGQPAVYYRTFGTVRQAWRLLAGKMRQAHNYYSGGVYGAPVTHGTVHNSNTGHTVACYTMPGYVGYAYHVNAQHTLYN